MLDMERLWESTVITSTDCWEWQGRLLHGRYPVMQANKKSTLLARAVYEVVHGELPMGTCVFQSCGNTKCLNPEHQTLQTGLAAHSQEQLEARAADTFWDRTELTDTGCMLWTGYVANTGYGLLHIGNRYIPAHRYAVELHTGTPVPKGKYVCHHCDTPRCVNPAHLFVGTPKDNVLDMHAKGRAGQRQTNKYSGKHAALRSHRAKLTDTQIIEIRQRYAAGETQIDLGKEYGVSNDCIHTIVTNKVYKDLAVQTEQPVVRGDSVVLTSTDIQRVVAGHLSGKTQSALAVEFGVSQPTVAKTLQKYANFKPKARMSKEDLDRARAMLAAGEMQRTVARTLNVSEATISRIANQITA